MDNIRQLIELLETQVGLMKDLLKAFEMQQKALIQNQLEDIQTSTLKQADLIESIARIQDKLHACLQAINQEFEVNLPQDSFHSLQGKIDHKSFKRIIQLLDLQKVYGMEIEEFQKNNQILIENALKFVQDHKQLIIEYMNEKPVYHDGRRKQMAPVNHLLNKKL